MREKWPANVRLARVVAAGIDVLPNSALLSDVFHSALRAARGAAKREG
jgi:hypothetical protein